MSCDRIVQRLSLPTKQAETVRRKGNELYRMSKIKMPTLGNFESCRAALCVEIALGDDLSTTTSQILRRLSTVNAKMYAQMMSRLQTVLKIRRGNSSKALRELALQFRCSNFLEFIKITFQTYQERFIQGLPQRRRAHADFSDPKYGAAALFLCARKRGVHVDRRKLIQVVTTDQGKFQDVLNSMTAICFDTIGRGQKQAALGVKQKRFLLDATSVQAKHSKSKEKDKKEYDEWRKRVLSASSSSFSSSSTSSSSSSSTSSTSLSSFTSLVSSASAATDNASVSSGQPPKKKQKVQATLFGAVIPSDKALAQSVQAATSNAKSNANAKATAKATRTAKAATAKQLAKENEQNVRDVDASIATLNALLQ